MKTYELVLDGHHSFVCIGQIFGSIVDTEHKHVPVVVRHPVSQHGVPQCVPKLRSDPVSVPPVDVGVDDELCAHVHPVRTQLM